MSLLNGTRIAPTNLIFVKEGQKYHTLRYDFKPASVNSDEPAKLELTNNGQVTIEAPNVAGSSSKYTVFRGQRRPHVKECLLIIDNKTGEMVLQKLTDNITVKATRIQGSGGAPSSSGSNASSNGIAPAQIISGSANQPQPPQPPSQQQQQHQQQLGSSTNGGPANLAGAALTSTMRSTSATNGISQSNHQHQQKMDGPQLSEESDSSSDSDSSSENSSSESSSNSGNSSPNDEGFTF